MFLSESLSISDSIKQKIQEILTMGDNIQPPGSSSEPLHDPLVTEDPNPGPESVQSQEETGAKPVCVIVLGMAGSGKTTFVQRLTSHLYSRGAPPYVMNLDPACREVPYPANIDIRQGL